MSGGKNMGQQSMLNHHLILQIKILNPDWPVGR
ncbi:hypothetical protein GLO73106DRAFT_00029840 [Gloeocapsa sp. PCC 73106]|nr:hypothetical protein GLO73106DRAFT_00029840 [Gloeocapsa sp. PCC 73106]